MKKRCPRIFDHLHVGLASVLIATLIGAAPDDSTRDDVGVRMQSYSFVLAATIDTSSSTIGIADSSLYFMDVDELTKAMDELQALGVTQIRVFLPWRAMEPSEGTYDWEQADQLLDMAESYGIAVVASVTSTPTWASDYGVLVANGEPSSATAYADFVGALAERYGTAANDGDAKISAYEVWNEPNGFTGWYPEPDAEQYTELLKAAYTAIKAVDPSATVIGGVLGSVVSFGSLTVNPVTFLTEMYEVGAAGYFDALSFHPYNYSGTFSEGASYVNSAINQLTALREIMIANGDADKLIWASEYGQPSTQVSEENQAAYIADFLATWSELNGVGPAFLYSLVDTATGSSSVDDNLGLFTDDWTAKAVVEVIKAWIAGEYTSPDPSEAASAGSLTELLSSLVRAAQSFVAGITAMVVGAVDGVTEFVRGVVNAVVGMVNSLSPAGVSTVATARTAAANADTIGTTTRSVSAVLEVVEGAADAPATTDALWASDEQAATTGATEPTERTEPTAPVEPDEPAEDPTNQEPADPSGLDTPTVHGPGTTAEDDDQPQPAAVEAATVVEEPNEAQGASRYPRKNGVTQSTHKHSLRQHGLQPAGASTERRGGGGPSDRTAAASSAAS